MDLKATSLPQRGLLSVSGPNAREFLQGLVTNDIDRVGPDRAIYAALLTAQGKYLHDFLILPAPDHPAAMVMDAEAGRLADLVRRLTMYRMRADVHFEDVSARLEAIALFGTDALRAVGLGAIGEAIAFAEGVAIADPRHEGLGARLYLPKENAKSALTRIGAEMVDLDTYDSLRISLCVPDGSRDIPVEKAFPLEYGFDALNAVSYTKGCFVGQELTARTHNRGKVKKALYVVAADGALPGPGTEIHADGRPVGEVRTGHGKFALAHLRIEDAKRAVEDGPPLLAGSVRVRPVGTAAE